MTWKLSDILDKQSRKNEFITFECTTKDLEVQQEVNNKFNFEDVNVTSSYHFWNLFMALWMEIVEKKNCVLLKMRNKSDSKYKMYKKLLNLSVVKYANLKIVKLTWSNLLQKFHVKL